MQYRVSLYYIKLMILNRHHEFHRLITFLTQIVIQILRGLTGFGADIVSMTTPALVVFFPGLLVVPLTPVTPVM